MAEAKQLQVGDVIYIMYHSGITGRVKITRVTNTQAFAGNAYKFRREVPAGSEVREISGNKDRWSRKSFVLETPELAAKYEVAKVRKRLDDYKGKLDTLTIDQMRRIIAIIEEKPGAAPSDLATGIPTLDRQEK